MQFSIKSSKIQEKKQKISAEKGDERCKLAIEMEAYRMKKYIGAYAAALDGVDAITFTAGIGENDARVREMVGQYLGYLGGSIDPVKNKVRGEETILSAEGDKVTVMIVPTNEELAIARETVRLI